jgi:glycosyltransferase involved in cell wall biosynthesis
VGRLVDQKDHLTLLKAINLIKKLCKFKLILIGRGNNSDKINNYIEKNNLSKFVKIFYTTNPFPYIKQADIFLLSSQYEGLPNVLLEALTLKKLVISSDCPTGPKEILDHGKGGLTFKMNNEFDLYKKIIFFIKNKSRCQKIINYGYNRLTRFDYHKNLKEYLKIINSLD